MKRTPSLLQRKTAEAKLNNPDLQGEKLVEAGGYGESVQKTPAKALESIGYKKALADFGLTEELITTALVEDIKNKPKKRISELGLGADILGMRKRDIPDESTKTVVAVQVIINAGSNPKDRTDAEAI